MRTGTAAHAHWLRSLGILALLLCCFPSTARSATRSPELQAIQSRSAAAQASSEALTPIRAITAGNGQSARVAISGDGALLAFDSSANNLAPNDTNGKVDIIVYDRVSGRFRLVTHGNSDSTRPSLSADGLFVAYQSVASNLIPDDINRAGDIFISNLRTGGRNRASVSSTGEPANGSSANPAISGNGRVVAFESLASNLAPEDTNALGLSSDIFVYDRATRQTVLVSVSINGASGNGASLNAAISGSGRYVAFDSLANDLVPDDHNGVRDVFVRDQVAGRTVRVSISSTGAEGNAEAFYPAISSDGRFVTFESRSGTLVSTAPSSWSKIFLHDRDADADGVYDEPGQVTTTLVSRDAAGGEARGDSGHATISADARQIAFFSFAPNLAPEDANHATDIFRYDRESGKIRRITQIPQASRTPGSLHDPDANSFDPALSTDGQIVAFHSLATNLTGNAGDGNRNIFVADTPIWLVLLYLAGDDILPSQEGRVGLTDYLHRLIRRLQEDLDTTRAMRLVALFDGNQDQDSALFYSQPGTKGLVRVSPEQLPAWVGAPADTGNIELNTGDHATLRSFALWARTTFFGSPHTMLSIVDHGGGWAPDTGAIGQPRGTGMVRAGGWSGIAFDASADGDQGSSISTRELREALSFTEPFDVVFLDACLMGMIEVAYEIQPYVRYLVAGTNQLWAQLPYEKYLSPTTLTATTTPRAFAQAIVEGYNHPPRLDEPFIIAALDMMVLPELVAQVEALAAALLASVEEPAARTQLLAAYQSALKFDYDSSFSLDSTDSFVDLGDIAAQLQRPEHAITAEVTTHAQQVGASVSQTVVAVKQQSGQSIWASDSWNFTRATGLSIYLPLGERDCRPTGLPIPLGGVPAEQPCQAPPGSHAGDFKIEPQLKYYARGDLLRFSNTDGAPTWAALLLNLDPAVLPRASDKPIMNSPFQGVSGAPSLNAPNSVELRAALPTAARPGINIIATRQ